MKKRQKKPRPCYLCDWKNASTQKPKRWIMCMDCYKLFSTSVIHDSFKKDCLRLYEYIYAAGRNRQDLNQDRAERFLAFLMTTRNPPTEAQVEAIHKDVNTYQEIEKDAKPKRKLLQRTRKRSSQRVLLGRRPIGKLRNQEVGTG
jgi:hypothetical protein